MLTMNIHRSDPTEYRSGVIGSVIACLVLLAGLVLADRLLWPAGPEEQTRHAYAEKAR